ncbi:YidC/Oxa1 family membrane protein insertase [Microbacterium sp. No. 7]|uniref:YidC/Oxa1 family membrane protein insertase n=1 Tax=Microbacterium sp. No. 7 TaxID=1714373 RepID=UPI0006D0D3E9|nr:membrane protein insertase YidC [Microbacterium sp. No. 7]ALJ19440.1 preprotein translocase YidC [Microbacterium sp. No. 7]
MDPFSFPPVAAVLRAASTALTWLADALAPLAGASSAALAVVLVTLVVRAALVPVGVAQARAEQARARLAPKLRAVRSRHAKDPERLQRETMRVYSDAGVSPLAGCLPLLAQAPVVAIIYGVFLHAEIGGAANELLTHELWGVPLGASAAGLAGGGMDVASVALFAAIAVVLLAVGEVTRRLFRIPAAADGPDLRWLGLLQFATAVIAMFVPLAAALYLVVTTAWTLGQRLVLRRVYPLDA